MILASLTRRGTVVLRPGTAGDRDALREVDYLRWRGGRAAVWWTHTRDLLRDLGPRLALSKGFKARLRRLSRAVVEARRGDDAAVLEHFAEGTSPRPFQFEAIHAILNVKRLVVADDTGLGKTIETIGAMMACGERRAVLVVPSGVKFQWVGEIARFARHPPRVVMASGNKDRRKALYRSGWDVLVINPELVWRDRDWLEPHLRGVGFVALDEASCIRNPDTDTARAMKSLFRSCPYRVALTATPVENKLADLLSVFEFVDPRCFPSEAYFNRRYVVWQKRTISVRKKSGRKVRIPLVTVKHYQHLDEVRAKIHPCYIRRRVQDVELELPPIVVMWEIVTLPRRQREIYDAIRRRLEPKLAGLRGVAMHAPLQALRQACNSTELVDPSRKGVHVKLARFRELLETEWAGEQVIAFTDYERFVRIAARELRSFGVARFTGKLSDQERERELDRFRAGDARVLLMTEAGERGLNLQFSSVVANLDLPWNPQRLKQRLGRVRRIGSEADCVRVANFIARDTVETRLIMKKIYEKRALFEGVFDTDELTQAEELAMSGSEAGGYL